MKRFWMLAAGCWLSAIVTLAQDTTKEDVTTVDAKKVKQMTFSGDLVNLRYNDGTPETTHDMQTLVIDFSNTTNINSPKATSPTPSQSLENSIYDLQGRRVADGKKPLNEAPLKQGIYIMKGKKVKN